MEKFRIIFMLLLMMIVCIQLRS